MTLEIVLKEEKKKEKETKTCGVLLDSACGCCKKDDIKNEENCSLKIYACVSFQRKILVMRRRKDKQIEKVVKLLIMQVYREWSIQFCMYAYALHSIFEIQLKAFTYYLFLAIILLQNECI